MSTRARARSHTPPSFAAGHNQVRDTIAATTAIDHAQEDTKLFDPYSTFVDDIPPREGFTQKWIRVRIGGVEDLRNISAQARLGWKPRPLDSVDTGYSPPSIKTEALGNVIGVGDLVLMEMPERRANMIREAKRERTQAQLSAVRAQQSRDTGGKVSGKHTSVATTTEPQFD